MNFFGNCSAKSLTIRVERLHMHRPPYRSRFNVGFFQSSNQRVSRCAKLLLIDEKATQPVCLQTPLRLRHRCNARKTLECSLILERNGAALRNATVQNLQLTPRNARQNIAESIVIAQFGVQVPRGWIARLLRPEACLLNP